MIPPVTTPANSATATSQPSPKLKQAAQEFEGMLISQLWKGFDDDPLTGSSGDDSDAGASTMKSLGLQAMSTALAAQGGLGIAAMVEKQLTPSHPQPLKMSGQPLKSSLAPADTSGMAGHPQPVMNRVQTTLEVRR